LANTFDSADFDNDGDVDGTDFVAWQRNLGSVGPLGDANADGIVNGSDYSIWKGQYGSPPPATVVVQYVPEPSSVLMGVGACAAAATVARKRRRALRLA
jgi:hypothetical protein